MDQNGETEFQPKDHVTIGIMDTYMGQIPQDGENACFMSFF